MIQEREIDIFLKAKEDAFAVGILHILSFLSLFGIVVLQFMELPHGYTVFLATLAATFMGSAIGPSKWVSVSRDQLVKTLERILDNDAGALKMLTQKRKSGVQASKRA